MKKPLAFTILVTYACLLSVGIVRAQEMSSGSYKIKSDSVNIGGLQGGSASYIVEDTLGEIATGDGSSTNFTLHAGYQQMQTSYLAITVPPSNVSLSPPIPGITGGTSNGSTSIKVLTDNSAGYQMKIKASTSPALKSTNDSFADYTPAGADPDFTFSILANTSEFGFTPEGSDIVQKFKDNGSACNTGSGDTASACWAPLSTTDQVIAQSSGSNQPSGTFTYVRFRAASGSSKNQQEGMYYSTTTITVLSL